MENKSENKKSSGFSLSTFVLLQLFTAENQQ